MACGIDTHPSDATLDTIRKLNGVQEALVFDEN